MVKKSSYKKKARFVRDLWSRLEVVFEFVSSKIVPECVFRRSNRVKWSKFRKCEYLVLNFEMHFFCVGAARALVQVMLCGVVASLDWFEQHLVSYLAGLTH